MSENRKTRSQEMLNSAKARRAQESERFWHRKTQLSYYLVSLPFAVSGVAIASYRYDANVPVFLAVSEGLAWFSLLASGGAGVRAKWAEMEQARIQSLSASHQIARLEAAGTESDAYTAGSAELSRRNQDRLMKAERAESFGWRWHVRLLALGVILWVLTRATLAVLGAL